MFCPNCGTEVTEGVFCPSCGTKIADEQIQSVAPSTLNPTPIQAPIAGNTASEAAGKKNSGMIVGIIAVAVVLIAMILVVKNHKTTVKLDNYVSVEYDGFNGYGTAQATFNKDAFEKDYQGKIKIDKKAIMREARKQNYMDYFDSDVVEQITDEYLDDYALDLFESAVSGSLDKTRELSNGDEVTYAWDCKEDEIQQYFKCKLKYKDLTFKVEGLNEVGTFNPFDCVEVTYSGIAPRGTAYVNCNSYNDEYGQLNYSLDRDNGLSNGDKVKVTVKIRGDERVYAERFGKLPAPLEQEYVVEGLMSYITSIDQVSDALMMQMQSQAEDTIRAYTAKWDKECSLKQLVYMGNYLLVSKNLDDYDNKNLCVLVYKIVDEITMQDDDQGTVVEDVDSYYYVEYTNLQLEDNGNGVVDISNYYVPDRSFRYEPSYKYKDGWWTHSYSFDFRGYESLQLLYNDVVTKNLERYAHEDNVQE